MVTAVGDAGIQRLRWVEDAGRWTLYEVVSGPRSGTLLAGPPGLAVVIADFSGREPPSRAEASERAEELLCSLLTPEQRAERETTGGCFWVATPHGPVRLGIKYDIRHRPAQTPWVERALCVVPLGWDVRRPTLPDGDLWINLLLMLLDDPAEFFRVAVVHRDVQRLPPPDAPCGRCGGRMRPSRQEWTCADRCWKLPLPA